MLHRSSCSHSWLPLKKKWRFKLFEKCSTLGKEKKNEKNNWKCFRIKHVLMSPCTRQWQTCRYHQITCVWNRTIFEQLCLQTVARAEPSIPFTRIVSSPCTRSAKHHCLLKATLYVCALSLAGTWSGSSTYCCITRNPFCSLFVSNVANRRREVIIVVCAIARLFQHGPSLCCLLPGIGVCHRRGR